MERRKKDVLKKITIIILLSIMLINIILPACMYNVEAVPVQLTGVDKSKVEEGKISLIDGKYYRVHFDGDKIMGVEYTLTGTTPESNSSDDPDYKRQFLKADLTDTSYGWTSEYSQAVPKDQIPGSIYIEPGTGTEPGSSNWALENQEGSVLGDIADMIGDALGGVLLNPLLDLLVSLGDTVINSLQYVMRKGESKDVDGLAMSKYLIRSDKMESISTTHQTSSGNSAGGGGREIDGEKEEQVDITVNTDKFYKGWLNLTGKFYYPMATYSPQEIFAGEIDSLDVNFFKSGSSDDRAELVKAISSWYIGLRNLAAVGLLLVLLYIGIRIIISSSTNDKAKYKQLLFDWLIALCILFFMHYIMSFTLTVIDTIIQGIKESAPSASIHVNVIGGTSFDTNLIGAARFQTQYKDIGVKVHYIIMYIALVIYTVIFTFYYLKRFFMMAFLTMIAPLVALTYPIDKISDGKAQAFDAWIKEYVYNALLQPFHLIIYTVFVTNALTFAKSNVIYMIASLWFVMEAEKILRGFFGFNKASGGTLGALHTIGLASMIGKMASGRKHLGGSNVGGQVEGTKPIKFHQSPDLGKLGAAGAQAATLAGPTAAAAAGTGAGTEAGAESQHDAQEEIRTNENAPGVDTDDGGTGDENVQETLRGLASRNNPSEPSVNDENTSGPGIGRQLKNLAFGNTYGITRKAGRAIKGVAKFGTRTAFRATTGGLAAAIAVASGGDMGAALAAYTAGAGIGERLGNKATSVVGKVPNSINTEIDMANGNNDRQSAAALKAQMKDENNLNYIRDKIIKEEGKIPSGLEVAKEMKNYKPYLAKGLDMQESTSAMKVAKDMGIKSADDAALMAAFIKERGITAAVLNKDADREQLIRNLNNELEKRNDPRAKQKTDMVMEFADRTHKVETKKERIARKNAEDAEKAARRAAHAQRYDRSNRVTGEQQGGGIHGQSNSNNRA